MLRSVALFVAMVLGSSIAYAESVTVTVPTSATGGFGSPNTGYAPLFKALTATRAGTIVVRYKSGTWSPGTGTSGPNGILQNIPGNDYVPLQETVGVTGGTISNLMALMAAFVPESDVNTVGFSAVDQTIIQTDAVGISPSDVFFVGSRKSIQVSGPGTLFLGPNDCTAFDGSGSLVVAVSFTPK